MSWITYDHLYDHINILNILYYIIHVICMQIYYILWYLLLLYCYYKYITYYIYYIFNGIHPWRLFRSCYRKLAWVGIEPMNAEFRLEPQWLGSQTISSTHTHRHLCAATPILPFVQCLGFIFLHLVNRFACDTWTKINIKSSINQMVIR